MPIDSGKLNNDLLHKYLKGMKANSGYDICPGVEAEYRQMKDKLKSKPVVLHEWPRGIRNDHVNCEIWFHAAAVSSKVCRNCNSLIKSMKSTAKKVAKRSTVKKTPPKSTNLKFMTPKTRKRTLRKKSEKLKKVTKKFKKYENYMCRLDPQQGAEMNNIMKKINKNFSEDLDQIFKENDNGDILKRIWENDLKQNRKDFYEDQKNNVVSDTGSRYSVITYRVALAVFTRSPAAYEALKSFNILQLPSVSIMKSYMRANREEPGPVYHRLAEEKKKYEEIKDFKRKMNFPVPFGEGALIFDEVKVSASIYWNAKSNKFIGHALTPENMSFLHDVYEEINPSSGFRKASYILQFLWRDITSNFNIIGPYYISENGLDHKFIMQVYLKLCIYSLFMDLMLSSLYVMEQVLI